MILSTTDPMEMPMILATTEYGIEVAIVQARGIASQRHMPVMVMRRGGAQCLRFDIVNGHRFLQYTQEFRWAHTMTFIDGRS